ncbi:MAG TPA: two pore domain potassium channel family protein [Candidatus Thalassarchaeaceae archaeon]|nr:potassium channel family protein [Candidatus Thalassarchaeaceae archaeon]DAC49465.1 MAG TPA: two pore domain potassium channel family protein [Candidatus Poseidoniales archaeon]HIH83330.1 two pore domain potassium channel family protein [Candidatus Thalassarchaeaceae archaeon]|tara:strand:+ start:301 stop:1299 length:999 start_codon:yes stop_codon:yes gene_type:complete
MSEQKAWYSPFTKSLINGHDIVFLTISLLSIGIIVFDSINDLRNSNSSDWTILVTIDTVLLGYFITILADSHSKSKDRAVWWKWNFWQVFALFPLLGTAIPGLGWAGALRFLLLVPAIQAIFRLLNVAEEGEISIQKRITHLFIIVSLLILAGAALALMFEVQYEERCAADISCDEGQLVLSLEDAVWWAIETTTTVGYGEFAPKSLGARVVASILLFVGIGLFGTLAATLSQLFFSNQMWRNSQREDFLVRLHLLTELHDRKEITDAQYMIEKKRLVEAHEDDTLLLEQMDKSQHQISKKSADINERKKRVDEAKKFFDEVANNGDSEEEV